MTYIAQEWEEWDNRPAQLEEINQCIYNHQVLTEDQSWYCYDNYYLLEQQSEFLGKGLDSLWGVFDDSHAYLNCDSAKDIRYDFLLVSWEREIIYKKDKNGKYTYDSNGNKIKDDEESKYTYTFVVRNTLWDGTFKVSQSMTNKEIPERYLDYTMLEANKLELVVKGPYRATVRVCFHMSQEGNGRDTSTLQIQMNDSYLDEQYNKSYTHYGRVIDTLTGKGKDGCSIKLEPCDKKGNVLTSGIPTAASSTKLQKYLDPTIKDTLTYGKQYNGTFSIPFGKVSKCGDYYVKITATYTKSETTMEATKIVSVERIQQYERSIDWGKESQYTTYKGEIKKFTFGLVVKNKYGMVDSQLLSELEGQVATINITKADKYQERYTGIINSKGQVSVEVSFRKYYLNESKMEVLIHATDTFPNISASRTLKHKFFRATSFNDIKTECKRANGCDYILVEPGNHVNYGDPIHIIRDQTIAGILSTDNTKYKWACLNGKGEHKLIYVESGGSDCYRKCELYGLQFYEGNNAITTEKYTNLTVKACYFTGNKNPYYNHAGSCIFNQSSAEARKTRTWYQMTISKSYFYNNYGNCIKSLGTTLISNNLFKTTNETYLKQPEPKVVIVESGAVTYRNNKSYIKVSDGTTAMKMNHSYAKALTYIDTNGTFNGKGPSQLKGDNTLPVFGTYNNQAYTYAIYYYPYSNVRTEITCSPRKGRERTATGHASAAKNWVFYDGYYFLRWEKGRNKGNRTDPWTSAELAMPTYGGTYNSSTKKFTDDDYKPVTQYTLNEENSTSTVVVTGGNSISTEYTYPDNYTWD